MGMENVLRSRNAREAAAGRPLRPRQVNAWQENVESDTAALIN
jgi:hypothetical protein